MKTLLKRAAIGLLAALACAFAAPAFAAVDCAPTTTPNTLGTTANAQLELLQQLCAAQTGAGFAASGKAAVTASLTSATSTSAFTPLAGRPFNVSLSGTFAATCGLQKSFNSGSTWLDLTYVDGSALTWSAPVLTDFTEGEASVQWRVSCSSYTSGTVVVRISQ